MKRHVFLITFATVIFLLLSASTFPDEGMWMLTQLDKLPWPTMQQHGLALTSQQIYSEKTTSLKDAIMLFGGGTSSFVSPEGLILTNHHVAFSAIQTVSSVADDYLKNGFYAKSREEELSVPTYTAQIVAAIKDVTSEILGAVSDTMSAENRAKTITAKSREIEKSAKGTTDNECRVSETYNGVKYVLYTYEIIRDIRLVYAPPTAIGNYGGEVDNWYWPRHTGDFSFMRAYVGADGKSAKYSKQNVPYKPKTFLPISVEGFDEGSFAMIMGFPGRTFRYRTSAEIRLAKEETLPLTMELFRTRMGIIEAAGKKDRAIEIKYASKWRGMANTYKNYQGTLEGMNSAYVLKKRMDREEEFKTFLAAKPQLQSNYGTVVADIASAYDELKTFNKKQTVLNQILSVSDIVGIARRFRDFANNITKDSTGKEGPTEASVKEMKETITNILKDVDVSVDKELLTALVLKGADLPSAQRINAVQRIVGDRVGEKREKAVREYVNDLFDDSKCTSQNDCEKLLTKSKSDIKDDELVQFFEELDKDNQPLQVQVTAFNAKIGKLRGKLLEAWMAWKGPDIYADANRTLRFTYGTVASYNPRDAVHYNFETTLRGVMEKETGEEPFVVPPKLRELWEKKDFGKYADQKTGDVPVAFLADLDITGGNSGSPVINGKGELIGLAFDGNWEAVVGDYLFQESLNRTISVDARYILFVLDKFSGAQNILNELSIRAKN